MDGKKITRLTANFSDHSIEIQPPFSQPTTHKIAIFRPGVCHTQEFLDERMRRFYAILLGISEATIEEEGRLIDCIPQDAAHLFQCKSECTEISIDEPDPAVVGGVSYSIAQSGLVRGLIIFSASEGEKPDIMFEKTADYIITTKTPFAFDSKKQL